MKKRILSLVLTLTMLASMCVFVPLDVSAEVYSPVDSINWNGHTYQLYDVPVTWSEAIMICLDLGGNLVEITSQSENNTISNLMKNGKMDMYWTGATPNAVRNLWSWSTGYFSESEFINWGNAEPSPAFGYVGMTIINKNTNDLNHGDWNSVEATTKCGFICEFSNQKSTVFSEELNRANWMIHDTHGSITMYMEDQFENAYGIQMVEEGYNIGYDNMVEFWQNLKNVDVTLDDVTKYENLTLSKIDMYEALLIELLEQSLDERNTESISINIQNEYLDTAKFLLDSHKSWFVLDKYNNLSYSTSSKIDKKAIRETVGDYYESKYSSLDNLGSVLKVFDTVLKTSNDISQAIICVESYVALRKLDSSMVNVLEMMALKCYDNNELKTAIERCLEIIELDDDELIEVCTNKISSTSLKAAAKCVIRYAWDNVTTKLLNYPPVLCIYLSFKGSIFLSDSLMNTSKKVEAYVKLEAMTDIEKIVLRAYDEIKLVELHSMYNRAVDIALNALYMDYDLSISYIKEIDESLLNSILAYFGGTSLPDLITSIETSKSNAQKQYGSLYDRWVESLKNDFPEQYNIYKGLSDAVDILDVEARKYVICCPVDVYIYDNSRALVGSVVNENVFFDKNKQISIYVHDNKKTIYLDKEDYSLELIGTDNGVMNITITEYMNGVTESKKIYFDNVPLSKDIVYQAEPIADDSPDSYLLHSDQTTIAPDYIATDSKSSVERLVNDIRNVNTPAKNDMFSGVSDWARAEIEEAVEKKLIPSALVFTDLRENINRKEFAALAVELYESITGKDAEYGNVPFKDISQDDTEIKKAYSLGITTGTSETTFEPNTLISREQLATMLCRVFKKYAWDGWDVDSDYFYSLNYSGVSKFADDDKISEYAIPSVYFMAKHKIINGVGNNKFAPKTDTADGFATREQAILMALRCYNNLFNDEVINDSQKACGENLTYDIDGSTLTIGGDGYMYDFRATVNAIVGEKKRPWNGEGIKKVIIEKGVKNIGAYAFYEFEELSEIEIKSDIESVGDCAFSDCKNLKNIKLPESVKIIGESSFSDCSSLTEIIIPDNVVSIQDTAFYRCSSLKKVKLGEELKEIGERAFIYCSGLTSITLHDKIDVICENAFSDCDLLTDVTYVGNESNIKTLFEENRETKELVFTRTEGSYDDNFTWKLENDTLIVSGKGKLVWDKINADILRKIKAKNLVIESGITELGESYFWSNQSFEKVVLPSTLEKLGIYTFRGCKNIKDVVFPDTEFTIDGGCFEGCINLTHIYLPEKAKLSGFMPFGEIAYGNPDRITITFYTSENSPAYNWAKNNGFNVVISTRNEFEQQR